MSGRRPSCRPCRKARIGCDAVLQKGNPCTNCVRRRKECNSQSIENRSQNRSSHGVVLAHETTLQHQTNHRSPVIDVAGDVSLLSPRTIPNLENDMSRRSCAAVLHDVLWEIFVSTFESRFALWLGHSCCPYLETTVGTKASVSRTVLYLDSYANGPVSSSASRSSNPLEKLGRFAAMRSNIDNDLNNALRYAVYAYASRWVPVRASCGTSGEDVIEKSVGRELQEQLWYQAKPHMFTAMSNPSYRSVLALLLFTLTEMPVENDDPGINNLCSQVLLNHFSCVRSPRNPLPIHPLSQSTTVYPLADKVVDLAVQRKEGLLNQTYQSMQDSILWLGILCDTSRAAVHKVPSVLLPGNSGDRKAWDFIRQRTVIFDRSFRVLCGSPLPLPEDVVIVVLQHASACKTMYLGVINQFTDSLSQHHSGSISEAASRISEERRRFHDVFDQLLAKCARDYLTMTMESQLNYVLLVAHYSLASLILAETLETLDTIPHPLEDPGSIRLQACNAVVHSLSLVLNYDRHSSKDLPHRSQLLLDPTPELMVEVLSRTEKAISSLSESYSIPPSAAKVMLGVVSSALTVLARISVTASFVLSSWEQSGITEQLRSRNDLSFTLDSTASEAASVISTLDGNAVREFLREMESRENLDLTALDEIIRKHDRKDLSNFEALYV